MNRILYQEEKNKNHNDHNKKELYKYIDLNDCSLYMKKIEKIAEKNGDFSIRILLNDLEQNVIFSDNIFNFKKDIIKNLNKMEKYFHQNLLIMSEILHQDCLDKFYKLIENEINDLIINKNYDYYLFIKEDLYEKLNLIYNSYKKIKNTDIEAKKLYTINKFIENMMKNYRIKTNILRKYNCSNMESISYEDLLYVNLNNIEEAENVLFAIKENNKIYKEKMLFNKIIEINKIKTIFNKSNIIKQINNLSYFKIICQNDEEQNLIISSFIKDDMFYLNKFNKKVIIKNKIDKDLYYYNNFIIYAKDINKHIEYKRFYINYEIKKYNYIDFINYYNNIKSILSKYMNKLVKFTKKGIGTCFFINFGSLIT